MTYIITCDWCGREIVRDGREQMMTILARGDRGGPKQERWTDGHLGHYHGRSCWPRAFDAIVDVHRQNRLEAIPTATPEQLAALRPPDHAGESPLDYEPLWAGERPCLRQELMDAGLRLLPGNRSYERMQPIRDAGIETFGDLRRAVENRSLLQVKGIEPSTFTTIQGSVETVLPAKAVTA